MPVEARVWRRIAREETTMGTEIRIVTAAERAVATEIVGEALAALETWMPAEALAELREHMCGGAAVDAVGAAPACRVLGGYEWLTPET
jgi:hypothetical protein